MHQQLKCTSYTGTTNCIQFSQGRIYNVIGRVGQLYTIKDNNGYNRQINIKGKFSVGSNDGNRNLYSIFKLV